MTTYASYGLEKHDPMLALAEAERLAKDSGREAARRVRDDGTIDVAVMEEGRFRLYLVDARGNSTLVESPPPPAGKPYWRALWWLLAAIFGIWFVATAIRFLDRGDNDEITELGLAGLVLVVALIFALASKRYGLRWHLSKRFDDPQNWKHFWAPSGWSPRSMAQIAAAERLAYSHEGKAMVRELPDGAAEVVTEKSGRLVRHRIDETGALTELPGSGRTPRFFVGSAIAVAGVLGMFPAFTLLGSAFGAFGALGGGVAMMMLVPLGATIVHRDNVERRVPRSESGTWYFLRTDAEPTGD